MLNQRLLSDRQTAKERLREPYFPIEGALDEEFAEALRAELLNCEGWETQGDFTMVERGSGADFKYSRAGITMGGNEPPLLASLHDYLNSRLILDWASDVSGRKCDFFEGTATKFGPGNQITRHNDSYTRRTAEGKIQTRAMTFNYWLAKDWLPEWGGRLVWEKPFAEITPTFNTLVLFLPTEISEHWVEPVTKHALAPRLAITGWFMTERDAENATFRLNI